MSYPFSYGYQAANPQQSAYWDHAQSPTLGGPSSTIGALTGALSASSLDDRPSPLSSLQHHGPPTYPFSPYSLQPSTRPGVEPIPEPSRRVEYAAPVFQTFQDRKRAKEAALRAQHASVSHPPVPTANPTHRPYPSAATPPIIHPPTPSGALMGATGSQAPTPPPRSPSVSPTPIIPVDRKLARSPLPQTPPAVPGPIVRVQQSQPNLPLERSDTVSSIKSLDRVEFSNGRRPLPQTPVGVNSSKSLDRGLPTRVLERKEPRRQHPSIVIEEEDETTASPLSPMITIKFPDADDSIARQGSESTLSCDTNMAKDIPTIHVPADDTDTKSPAKFTPLPSFNLPEGDSDDEPVAGPSAPAIAIAGPPVISVSSNSSTSQPTRLNNLAGAIVCAGCDQPIIGRIVNAMDQRFHPQCFKCNECGEYLEHVSSYEWEGRAYCHLDYHDKFANHCYHCKTPIVEDRFVTLDDPVLGKRYYHELHFFCSECGDPFLDPSKSSAPGARRPDDDDEGETNPFVIQKGHPYCERCHIRLHKPKCRACRKPIPEIALNALGHTWHQECFVCSDCAEPFANNLFFPKDGGAFCTSCWENSSR